MNSRASNIIISVDNRASIIFARLQYVVDFLDQHPLKPTHIRFQCQAPQAAIRLIYGPTNHEVADRTFQVPAQQLFFTSEPGVVAPFGMNAYAGKTHTVYAVEVGRHKHVPLLQDRRFSFDIFETLFFHISRWEEVHATDAQKDKHGMLEEKHHLLVRHELHQLPVVDHLVTEILAALDVEVPSRQTEYRLTHDIDAIRKYPSPTKFLRGLARLLFLEGRWSLVPRYIRDYVQVLRGGIDPYDTFEWLLTRAVMDKVIFLMAGGHTRYEGFYNVDSPEVRKIIALARERNYQIGLHPSYLTWRNANLWAKEKQTLENIIGDQIRHTRQHFLHFDFPDTCEIIEQLSVSEDSSLGYQHLIGFRCGTGFPFHLYNFSKEQPYTFLENPMVVMDVALVSESRATGVAADQLLFDFLEKNKRNTAITFNFHNSSFDPLRPGGAVSEKIYRRLFMGQEPAA